MSNLFLPLFFLLFILPVIFGREGEGEGDGPNSNPNLTLTWSHYDSIYVLKPCNKSREVIQDSWFGRISDGPSNYTHDTTCEWLVKGKDPQVQVDKLVKVVTQVKVCFISFHFSPSGSLDKFEDREGEDRVFV